MDARLEVREWILGWSEAIRNRDYVVGRSLFAENVTGFGTLGEALIGIDAPVDHQWREIWPQRRGFNFDLEALRQWGDGDFIVVACPWSSEGVRADRSVYPRRGWATLTLQRNAPAGRLRAVHTHFSMAKAYVARDMASAIGGRDKEAWDGR